MAVLAANNLSVSFGENVIFSDVAFEIGPKDKVGLIGANGAGKTTIFKVITGEIESSEGDVFISKNVRIGYMSQHACRDEGRTIYDEMLSVFSDVEQMEAELEEINSKIDANIGDINSLIERQQFLHTEYDRRGGLSYKSRARSALLGLGFEDRDLTLPCSAMSGGQLSKIALGKLLLSGAELLLLDEPTNHLDITSVEWLENWLSDFNGAALIISHDRYFLDKLTNKTMELERGRLTITDGNYTRFMQLKKERLEYARRHYENTMREVHRIEGIIEQQRTFSQERNFITIAHKQKSIDRLLDGLEEPDRELENIHFTFKAANVSGNEVLTAKGLKKSYDGKLLFENVDFLVKRNERVFLLGDNGCGKSTLFNIIMNRMNADSGRYIYGSAIKIGYFEQTLAGLNPQNTALDEIWNSYRNMTELEVRKAMALFLFKGDSIYKKVEKLSGGEKARIALIKIMLSGSNVLMLDEPTNHLDIGSREALEQALEDYDGTLFVISHDRYFINRIATRILWLHKGGVKNFDGNYDYFLSHFERPKEVAAPQKKQTPTANAYKKKKEHESELRWAKGRLTRCESEIEEVERLIEETQALLEAPETSADYEKVLELSNRINELNKKQEELLELWEKLTEEYDRLQNEEI